MAFDAQWDDETLFRRMLKVDENLSVSVVWPGFFWHVFDRLTETGWDSAATIRSCWQVAADSTAPHGQHASFKSLLEDELVLRGDAAAAPIEGRANNNLIQP